MDNYSGHVEPGGAAIARTVRTATGRQVEVRKLSVGPMDNNAYVLTDVGTGRALLIDAANDADRLLDELRRVTVEAIVTTHGHADHWQALTAVAEATAAPVWVHPADQPMITHPPDRPADDGATVTFGDAAVELIHNPGHTPGSVSILLRGAESDHLFTGDTLFPGGPGNTFGNADAFAEIMRSLATKLFVLPDATWVYPGHGDDTTLGRERPQLEEWRARGW